MSWTAASLLVLLCVLGAGFAWYERSHPSSKVLALVGTLAALAALGRIAFAPLPNVKPTTDIVLLTGYALGGAPGFMVGALAALTSNFFFGQGPWTAWQMTAWGMVGVGGAVVGRVFRHRLRRLPLAIVCGLAGFAYGVVMNLFTWMTFSGDHTPEKFVALSSTALPFDLLHAAGNLLFCLAFGPALVRALERFRARFEVNWTATGAAASAIAAVLVVFALAAPAEAQGSTTSKSLSYLTKAQNSDGGFGASPSSSSNQLHSGWAALGMAAAGVNPQDVKKGKRSVIDYIRKGARKFDDAGDLERTILVVEAAGLSSSKFGGRNLVGDLLKLRKDDGSIGDQVNYTAFGVLALRAAGRDADSDSVKAAADWLVSQQNEDGGFNFAKKGSASGIDDTAAALQALAAAGRDESGAATRAVSFLREQQGSDGGFPLQPGDASNAQSTSWAVQALIASGREPAKVRHDGGRDPIAYLKSLTTDRGLVRYSRSSAQTPVWVTAQALTAVSNKAFPLGKVPRVQASPSTPVGTGASAPTPSTGTPAQGSSAPAVPSIGPSAGLPSTLGASAIPGAPGAKLPPGTTGPGITPGIAPVTGVGFGPEPSEEVREKGRMLIVAHRVGQQAGNAVVPPSRLRTTAKVTQSLIAAGSNVRTLPRKAPSPLAYVRSLATAARPGMPVGVPVTEASGPRAGPTPGLSSPPVTPGQPMAPPSSGGVPRVPTPTPSPGLGPGARPGATPTPAPSTSPKGAGTGIQLPSALTVRGAHQAGRAAGMVFSQLD